MNRINFLLESNIDELYNSIKDRIYSQINYDIDTKDDKYKAIVNKLLVKISKKDLCLEDLNNMAIETISPFLVSKIHNTTPPNISVPNNYLDIQHSIISETIDKEDYSNFASNLNTIDNFESNEPRVDETTENILENNDNLDDEKPLLEHDSYYFLKGFNEFDIFEKYDHSVDNVLSNSEKNENLDINILDTLDDNIIENDISSVNSVINIENDLSDINSVTNLEIHNLKEKVNLLKSKLNPDQFIDKYQISTKSITTKTLLILDISKNENYDRSIDIFGPHDEFTANEGKGWGIGAAANQNVGDYIQTKISNIRDYNIKLNDSLFYPANTEVWLDSFTIHKFQGYSRTSTNTTEAIKGKDFSNFIVRIRGGKFEHIKKYSNQNNFTDNATIIIQNNKYGETDNAALKNQFTYNFTTQDHYIGTLKEGGIIDSLHIDLLGTFVDTTDTPENGFSTWTYMYPWDVDAQCIIRLNLIPPR